MPDALVAFAGRDGVADQYRAQARQLLGVIDRGHRAFVDERTKGQIAGVGASSARDVSRAEAAVLLKVTPQRVGQLVAEGVLKSRSVGRRVLVDGDSLDREIARRKRAA